MTKFFQLKEDFGPNFALRCLPKHWKVLSAQQETRSHQGVDALQTHSANLRDRDCGKDFSETFFVFPEIYIEWSENAQPYQHLRPEAIKQLQVLEVWFHVVSMGSTFWAQTKSGIQELIQEDPDAVRILNSLVYPGGQSSRVFSAKFTAFWPIQNKRK